MDHIIQTAFVSVLRSSAVLAVAAMVVCTILWLLRPRSPLAHRAAWGCVLLCGLLVVQKSLEIPWYDPLPVDAVVDADLQAYPEMGPPAETGLSDGTVLETERVDDPQPTAAAGFDWRVLVLVLWVTGMAVTVVLTIGSYLLLLFSLRNAVRAHPRFQRSWQQLLRSERISADIPLMTHPRLGPMLCRTPRRFMVVVPEDLWSELNETERTAVLRHELAHYQRRDVWTSLVARVLTIPHWFNPLAWWAVRKFEEGGEWACDQRLLSDPHQVPAFARALLAMSQPANHRVCASAARGSSVSIRIRRILSFQTQEDSIMKRGLLCMVLISLVTTGLLRVQLVARAQDDGEPTTSAQIEQQLNDFTDRLHDKGLLAELKAVLQTPQGQVVLREHASMYEEELRNQARDAAVPDYLNKYFVKGPNGYQVRPDQAAYREQLIKSTKVFNEDVERIATALRELAQKIDDRSEVDRLLKRFMNEDASATMLYVQHLRERLRPDQQIVERLLGELFVRDEAGKYIVRPGRRVEAEHHLKRTQQARKVLKPMRSELTEWASEFSEKDELHKEIKQALGEPLFASFILSELIDDEGGKITQRVEQFFEQMSHIAVDTADGLEVVEDEARGEIAEAIERYRHLERVAKKLSGPLKQFAAQIDDSQELEKGWKQLLSSELVMVRLGGEYEFADAEPGEIVRALLAEVLEEPDEGKLHVSEDRAEEVTEFVRDAFRQYRAVRRQGRTIEELASEMDDKELQQALMSMGGKYAVLYSIRDSLRGARFNGLSLWIEEHFEESDNGLVLREGAEEMVQDFLGRVREVSEELKKDDF